MDNHRIWNARSGPIGTGAQGGTADMTSVGRAVRVAATLLTAVLSSGTIASAADAPIEMARDEPATTLRGIVDRYGAHQLARSLAAQMTLGRAAGALPTLSIRDLAAEAAFARSLLTELDRVPLARLGAEDRLTAETLRWLLHNAETLPQDYWYTFPAPYTLSELGDVGPALASNPLATASDRAAYVALLGSIADRLQAMRQRLADQDARGIRMTRRQIPRGRAVLENFRTEAARWSVVPDDRLARLPENERRPFAQAVQAASARIVPAADALLAALGPSYEAKAPDTVGLAQYPGGRDYYRMLARRSTTMTIEPTALQALGQRMLDANNEALADLATKLGVPGGRPGLRDYANSDPRFIAKSADEVVARYDRCLARLTPRLPAYFGRLPKAPYRTRRLDPGDEAGMTFGYYKQSSSAQPYGEYRFNGSNLEKRSLASACALIFHELMPGHHLQRELQAERAGLPAFRRTSDDFTAFSEGWAEYASNLTREMGALDDPYDLLGRLMMNNTIFTRLVVDVGLNHDGWTYDRARDFMRANTFYSDAEIDSEILRYSSDIPAQALAYASGYLAIADLRQETERRLGRRFDIRRFHDEVVGHGSLPIDVLKDNIRRTLR